MSRHSLPFYKLSPGGNPTILVHDDTLFSAPEDAGRRAAIARILMDPGHIGAEQVGFLDTSRTLPHMEMMGGEFCVNATRSAAFVFAALGLLPPVPGSPGTCAGEITTSGADGPVRVRTAADGSGEIEAAAAVPLPIPSLRDNPLVRALGPGETLIRLPGIAHLLLDEGLHGHPQSPLEAAASKRAEHALENGEATGVVWYRPCAGEPDIFAILPVVHVAATGSSIIETACGSGSLALALVLAARGETRPAAVRQPSGGRIAVTFEESSPLRPLLSAWVSGPVRLTAQGTAHVLL